MTWKWSSSCWAPHIPLAPWICVLVDIGWDDWLCIQAQTTAHGYTCVSDLSETPWHNLHLETIQLIFQSDLGGLASSTGFNKVAVLFLLWLFQYSTASIVLLQPFIVTQSLWKEVKFPTARGIPCIGRRSGSLFHVSFTVTFLFFSSSIDSMCMQDIEMMNILPCSMYKESLFYGKKYWPWHQFSLWSCIMGQQPWCPKPWKQHLTSSCTWAPPGLRV